MKLLKTTFIIFPILLFLAITLDCLQTYFSAFHNWYLIPVDSNYNYYIFSAIVTIGVLGITLMSIALNSLSMKFIGFEIKYLIRFTASPIKMLSIILSVFITICFSIILLFLEFQNSLSTALFGITFYIAANSYLLWNLIINDITKEELIKDEIRKNIISNNKKMISFFIQTITYETCEVIDKKNMSLLEPAKRCLDLIEKEISNE